MEGVQWGGNLSTSYLLFGVASDSDEPGTISIPACDGDLLYLFPDDEDPFYYRYNSSDGTRLTVSVDTAEPVKIYVNGNLAFLELEETSSSIRKFEDMANSGMKILSIGLSDTLTEEGLETLRNHREAISRAGIILDQQLPVSTFTELFSICRPRWMVMTDPPVTFDPEEGKPLSGLELLWLGEDEWMNSNILEHCTHLQSLILSDWTPSVGKQLSLSGHQDLHSLTLSDCGIRSLDDLDLPPHLKRLYLIGCDTLASVEGLDQLRLQGLSLAGSGPVPSLDPLYSQRSLEWISLPPGIGQSTFDSIIRVSPSVRFLEILDCPGITDLAALEDQEGLQGLLYNADSVDFHQLNRLHQLDLLVLNSSLFEKSPGDLDQLKASLPGTEVYPGNGFCLGSGWLILMIPIVLCFRLYYRRRIQKGPTV